MLATSRRDVSAALRRLSQRLGELREYRPVRDPGKVLAVGVGGGLPPDGLRHVMNIDYTASFEKVPDARLRLQFVQGQDEWSEPGRISASATLRWEIISATMANAALFAYVPG